MSSLSDDRNHHIAIHHMVMRLSCIIMITATQSVNLSTTASGRPMDAKRKLHLSPVPSVLVANLYHILIKEIVGLKGSASITLSTDVVHWIGQLIQNVTATSE